MNKRGFFDFGLLELFFFLVLFSLLGFIFWQYITIYYPVQKARRDYLLKHPEQSVVSEFQRGGQLPAIPEINVNMKSDK